jgi:hypothetical protein
MPRKSAAARAIAPAFAHKPVPVQPPATLSEPARKVFIDLISSCDPRHFETSDTTPTLDCKRRKKCRTTLPA